MKNLAKWLCCSLAVASLWGCVSQHDENVDPTGSQQEEVSTSTKGLQHSLSVKTLGGLKPEDVAAVATSSLTLNGSAIPSAGSARVGRLQSLGKVTLTGATAGDILAKGVVSGSDSQINGTIVAGGAVSLISSATTGTVTSNATISDSSFSWQVDVPDSARGAVSLGSGQSRVLVPDAYGKLSLSADAKVYLTAGSYVFAGMSAGGTPKIIVDTSKGPVLVYFTALGFRGRVPGSDAAIWESANGGTIDPSRLLVSVTPNSRERASRAGVEVDASGFSGGTLVASLATVTLSGTRLTGAVFADAINLRNGASIDPAPFDWSSLVPPDTSGYPKVAIQDSPIRLFAADRVSDPDTVGSFNPPSPINFRIPDRLIVQDGNAGNFAAKLVYKPTTGANVTCTYKGGSPVAHPLNVSDFARGREYVFVSCTNKAAANSVQAGSAFSLSIAGDPEVSGGVTSVGLDMGQGGCSEQLGQFISPAQSRTMIESFSWATAKKLPENNADGTPTLFYANIYIRNAEERLRLNQLLIHYQKKPLFEDEMARLGGHCGTLNYDGDGEGIFVYAVIPGATYNKILEARTSPDVAPEERELFKAIILKTPPSGAKNPDNSLKIDILKDAGFRYMNLDILPDDAALDALSASDVEILQGMGVGKVLVGAVTFVAKTARAVARTAVQVLGALDRLLAGSVEIKLDVDVLNRDPHFGKGSPMLRGWKGGGAMPMPGLRVEIMQWAQRLYTLGAPIPTSFVGHTDENGYVKIKVGKSGGLLRGSASPRGTSGMCIELANDAAFLTGFLLESEFCNFEDTNLVTPGDPTLPMDFENGSSFNLRTQNNELHAIAQMTDMFEYARDVVGHRPARARVMTGANASVLAPNLTNKDGSFSEERLWAPCGSFDTAVTRAIGDAPLVAGTTVAALAPLVVPGVGPLIAAGGLIVGAAGTFYLSALAQTDIVFPATSKAERDRVVISHEYGHYVFCSMLNEAQHDALNSMAIEVMMDGSGNGSGLFARAVHEGFADFLTGQITGSADYQWLPAAGAEPGMERDGTLSNPRYCDGRGVCFDANYTAVSGQKLHLDVARVATTLFDAFDGRTSARFGDTWMPTDSDNFTNVANGSATQSVCAVNASGFCLEPAATPYGQANDDAVMLTGRGLRTVVQGFADAMGPVVAGQPVDAWFGKVFTPQNLNKGVNKAMVANGENWCNRCRLFALHSALAPSVETGASLTEQDAWNICKQDPDVMDVLGEAPPDADLRLDLANGCVPCPAGQISDATGVCTACPGSQVTSGNQCQACPVHSVPNANRDGCTECPANTIVSGNFCVACNDTSYADTDNNACVACPVDATFNGAGACSVANFTIPAKGPKRDACRDRFVVEVQNEEKAAADPQFRSLSAYVRENTWPKDVCQAFGIALTSTYNLNGSQSFFKSNSGFGEYGSTVSGIGCSFENSGVSFSSSEILGRRKYPIRIQVKTSGSFGDTAPVLFVGNHCSRVQ